MVNIFLKKTIPPPLEEKGEEVSPWMRGEILALESQIRNTKRIPSKEKED